MTLLGAVAPLALPEPCATAFVVLGLVYGVPVLGFAFLWAALATAVSVHTARAHPPFSSAWSSSTFPVVTGARALTPHSGSAALGGPAVALHGALVAARPTVATRSVRVGVAGRVPA
ncbi:hypothetical protein I4J48_06745 [Pseudonocardia sp. KRD-169]|uniref:Uncharacterized protein n=1 Tax=Pseudonocardia abyssalis TaxID=2792008 RepID=A0ABS6URX7_9PSEU|nr:hypothetical protein [Pseudonocardia abyssalis]MBW0114954.1 hypothetical protein [Pseudonocardia abyssalis]MBW0134623.1 hypothetical protein [Pseudonocardia abyssalis]